MANKRFKTIPATTTIQDLADIQSNWDKADSDLTTVETRVTTIVAGAGASNTEILDARFSATKNKTFPVLKDRLDAIESDSTMGLNRQALINGGFDVPQRGTSFTNPANTSYTSDRWRTLIVNAGILPTSIIHSRQPLTAGDLLNSFYYYRVNVNGAGSGFTGIDGYLISQPIEYGTRYLCGAGKKLTISFYARSDIAGKKIGVRAVQIYGSGGSPSGIETLIGNKFTLTTTWTKYTVTLTTNTLVGKTFGTNNDDILSIDFGYMWGAARASDYGDTVVETFGGAGNIDIAQIQVNAGDQALPFQPRSYNQENLDSLRYRWQSWADSVVSGSIGTVSGVAVSTGALLTSIRFPVPMRVLPTVSVQNNNVINQVRNSKTGVAVVATYSSIVGSNKGFSILSFTGAPFTVGEYYDFDIIADAEL